MKIHRGDTIPIVSLVTASAVILRDYQVRDTMGIMSQCVILVSPSVLLLFGCLIEVPLHRVEQLKTEGKQFLFDRHDVVGQ